MIDLTPLDVRKKRGDFGKGLRGYDPQEVDGFLELVAERMEVLVKENLAFREQVDRLGEKVAAQEGREQAVQDALVTAQELRQDVKEQANREAKLLEREARGRIQAMIAESEKRLREHHDALQELERQRDRFLKAFRTFMERELDTVEVELGRAPLEDITLDLDLGKGNWSIDDDDEDDDDDGGGDVSATEYSDVEEGDVSAVEYSEVGEGGGATMEHSNAEDAEVSVVESSEVKDEDGPAVEIVEIGDEDAPAVESAEIKDEDVPAVESAEIGDEDGPGEAAVAKAVGAIGSEVEPVRADEVRSAESEEGEDSLWLSSIMTDAEDEEAE
jgi:DivIVA domain-containing protein